jgi:hypothetical protein
MTDYGYLPLLEQCCDNCRYMRVVLPDNDALSCRRYAPRWAAASRIQVQTKLTRSVGWFPAVVPGGWCGEWVPREVSE